MNKRHTPKNELIRCSACNVVFTDGAAWRKHFETCAPRKKRENMLRVYYETGRPY